jgi:ABC-type antimicrobial peptide transport system permease subunit
LPPTITFTLSGKTFEKSAEDFLKVTKTLEPGRVQKYSTVLHGKKYPIRQVLAAVTKLQAIAITSQDAFRILEGHDFTEADTKDSELVVVVSKTVAQRLFPGQDALNRHILWTDPLIKVAGISRKGRRIIGVLADVDDANILPQHNLTIYQQFAQGPVFGASLLVRSGKNPIALITSITKTIRAVAATQPVEHASTLEEVRTEVLANNRVNAIVFGGFAILALAISVVGIAAVLAFSVSWRTREFAIRLAVGAPPRRILANVLLDGATTAAIGIAAGGLVGWGLSSLAGNYVAELQLPGPIPLIGSAAVVVASAVLASLVPAARAARVDTIQALRAE